MNSLRPHHVVSLLAAGGILLAAMQFGGSPGSGQPLFQNLDQFALFAEEEIKLEQGTQVSSGDLGSNKTLDIQKDAIVNGNLFADKLTIDKDSQVNGNASFNKLDIKRESQILGTKTHPISLPIAALPEVPDFQVGTEDFKFKGQNNTLSAGSYRDLTLEKDGRLALGSGTYDLRKLELKEGAVLLFSQSTILNIKEELKAQQNVSILPAQNGLEPEDLAINYVDKKPIEIGKRALLTLKLLAPKADIHIGEEGTIRGQMIGKKVEVGKETVVSIGEFFAKESDPSKVVEDQGAKFVVNEIIVLFKDEAAEIDAQTVASLVDGRITGFVPVPKIYKVEVSAANAQQLNEKIELIKNLNNPLIVEVGQNQVLQ